MSNYIRFAYMTGPHRVRCLECGYESASEVGPLLAMELWEEKLPEKLRLEHSKPKDKPTTQMPSPEEEKRRWGGYERVIGEAAAKIVDEMAAEGPDSEVEKGPGHDRIDTSLLAPAMPSEKPDALIGCDFAIIMNSNQTGKTMHTLEKLKECLRQSSTTVGKRAVMYYATMAEERIREHFRGCELTFCEEDIIDGVAEILTELSNEWDGPDREDGEG
jgi:hypothetical protein